MLTDKGQLPKGRHLKSHKTISERILLFSAKNMFLENLDLIVDKQHYDTKINGPVPWVTDTALLNSESDFLEERSFKGYTCFETKWVGVLSAPGNSESFSKNFENKPRICSSTDKPVHTAVAKCSMAGILLPVPLSFSYNSQAFQNLIHPSTYPVTEQMLICQVLLFTGNSAVTETYMPLFSWELPTQAEM